MAEFPYRVIWRRIVAQPADVRIGVCARCWGPLYVRATTWSPVKHECVPGGSECPACAGRGGHPMFVCTGWPEPEGHHSVIPCGVCAGRGRGPGALLVGPDL